MLTVVIQRTNMPSVVLLNAVEANVAAPGTKPISISVSFSKWIHYQFWQVQQRRGIIISRRKTKHFCLLLSTGRYLPILQKIKLIRDHDSQCEKNLSIKSHEKRIYADPKWYLLQIWWWAWPGEMAPCRDSCWASWPGSWPRQQGYLCIFGLILTKSLGTRVPRHSWVGS